MPPNGQSGNNQNSEQEPVFTPPQNFEPPQAPGVFQVQPLPASKTKKVLTGIVIGAGVLALIAGILLYVFLVVLKPAPVEEEKEIPNLSASTVVSEVKALALTTYPEEILGQGVVMTKPALVVTDEALAPAYQSEGYQYLTQYESDAAFSYTITVPPVEPTEEGAQPASDPVKILSGSVEEVLKDKGLEATANATSKETVDGVTSTTSLVVGRGVVCEVVAVNSTLLQKGTVRCGDQAEYTKTAAQFQPFVEGITNVKPLSTFRALTEVDSDAGGYKRATLQVVEEGVESTVYFYKKDAGRWLHLTTTKDEKVTCTVFSQLEMQRAYLNVPCADPANANATVQIPEKKR